jgi:hypothetical protein
MQIPAIIAAKTCDNGVSSLKNSDNKTLQFAYEKK